MSAVCNSTYQCSFKWGLVPIKIFNVDFVLFWRDNLLCYTFGASHVLPTVDDQETVSALLWNLFRIFFAKISHVCLDFYLTPWVRALLLSWFQSTSHCSVLGVGAASHCFGPTDFSLICLLTEAPPCYWHHCCLLQGCWQLPAPSQLIALVKCSSSVIPPGLGCTQALPCELRLTQFSSVVNEPERLLLKLLWGLGIETL